MTIVHSSAHPDTNFEFIFFFAQTPQSTPSRDDRKAKGDIFLPSIPKKNLHFVHFFLDSEIS
jgi:hypothetical protein